MFDARSILDAIIAGSSEQTRGARESGELKDIMGDILGELGKAGGRSAAPASPGSSSGNALDDILGELGRSLGRPQNGGGEAVDYGELVERVKELAINNKGAAGAIIGGLGGLLLGTRTGRSLVGRAVRLGGLALIGALAYKALKNYQQGVPAGEADTGELVPAPSGSGYRAEEMGHDDAVLFIRTMVAAAGADGKVDHAEQQKILGQLEQTGMDADAMQFLADEFNHPASVDTIVSQLSSRDQAAKVYAAARVAIEPDTVKEQAFLAQLAQRLGLDSTLAAHIDAAATGIKAR